MPENPKFDAMLTRIKELHDSKNDDYAEEGDPFKNFRLCEEMAGVDVFTGVVVRICDKFSRLTGFVKKGYMRIQEETVVDTLVDMAVYCLIAAILYEEKGEE